MNYTKESEDFDQWLSDLAEMPQPTCNLENPEQCDSCGA